MSDHFFHLSTQEQSVLIKKAGDQFDMPELVIEKDIWMCWLLEKIFALPIQIVFKGGTSLSKAFGLIHRFSEDCDITIDYHNFKPDLQLDNISRTQLKKVSNQLKIHLREYISRTVLPYLQNEISTTFSKKLFEITLSDDGEQLRFYYPSVTHESLHYLRDHVFIEFGVRNSTEPCDKHLIKTYLSQVISDDFILPKPMVNTLSPIRTYFEKATLMHVECHRDHMTKTAERLSRHWYDLFMLNNSWVGKQALTQGEILTNVIEHKKAFFNSSYAHYDDCLLGKFCLIPEDTYLQNLKDDFTQMIRAGMFHQPPPVFDEMIKALSKLEKTLNKIAWK